uniref:Uncharacterized protein n=1 Tax=Phakopsora pachyrhizi TaxID=170000 RepID=A0A0S1MJT3_PHAPC
MVCSFLTLDCANLLLNSVFAGVLQLLTLYAGTNVLVEA